MTQAFGVERDLGRYHGRQRSSVMHYAQRQQYPPLRSPVYPAEGVHDYTHAYANIQPSQYKRHHYNMGYTAPLRPNPIHYNAYDTRYFGRSGKAASGLLMTDLNTIVGKILRNYDVTVPHERTGKAAATYHHLEDVQEETVHQDQGHQYQKASSYGKYPYDPRVRRLPTKSRKKGSKVYTDSSKPKHKIDDETPEIEEYDEQKSGYVKKKGSNESSEEDDNMPEVEYEEIHETDEEDGGHENIEQIMENLENHQSEKSSEESTKSYDQDNY